MNGSDTNNFKYVKYFNNCDFAVRNCKFRKSDSPESHWFHVFVLGIPYIDCFAIQTKYKILKVNEGRRMEVYAICKHGVKFKCDLTNKGK